MARQPVHLQDGSLVECNQETDYPEGVNLFTEPTGRKFIAYTSGGRLNEVPPRELLALVRYAGGVSVVVGQISGNLKRAPAFPGL